MAAFYNEKENNFVKKNQDLGTMTSRYITMTLLHVLLFGVFSSCQGQELEHDKMIVDRFKEIAFSNESNISKDALYFSLWGRQEFNFSVSDKPIDFDTSYFIIKNPYIDQYSKNRKFKKNKEFTYPIGRSIIYNDRLITLFEGGNFTCLNLENYLRDSVLENKMKNLNFRTIWISNEKLKATYDNHIYEWIDNEKWIKVSNELPFKSAQIVLDNNDYIVFRDCIGEWGGTLYFYNKNDSNIYFTESSCANTVTVTDRGYEITSNMGHGSGFSKIKLIERPNDLSITTDLHLGELIGNGALGYQDSSNAYTILSDIFGFQVFSSFKFGERTLHLICVGDITCIGEIEGNRINVVDIPFNKSIYTHDPVTIKYGKYAIMSLDFYGTGLKREVSVIILKNKTLTQIDWNKNHFG